MSRSRRLSVLALIFAFFPGLHAQTVNSVVNGASFAGNPAPGSLATIFGDNLSKNAPINASELPLPTTLGEVQVTVNGHGAPLIYVSATQINFQVPYEVTPGPSSVVVIASGVPSPTFLFTVVKAAPGIFVGSASHAAAQNQDLTSNDSGHPAASGSVVVVYLTGQGPVDNPVGTGAGPPSSPHSNATLPFSATIGGQNAPVQFLGLTPGFAGLAQANIQVPALSSGSYPVVITVGGVASNGPELSIEGAAGGTPGITLQGSLTLPGTPPVSNNVVVNGTTAYACGSSAINVVDVSNPAAPKLISTVGQGDLGGAGVVCEQLGKSLIEIVGAQTVLVYDISQATKPSLLTSIATSLPFPSYVFFSGQVGFFETNWFNFITGSNQITVQHGELYVYDFTNPAQPAFLGSLQPDPNQPASSNLSPRFGGVAVDKLTAYVTSTTSTGGDPNGGVARVEVVDISNPASTKAVGEVDIPQATIGTGIAIQGKTALVLGNTKSWRNPGTPNFSSTGFLTLTLLDISDSRNPVAVSSQTTNFRTNFDIGNVVLPLGNGFFVISITPPAPNASGGPAVATGHLAIVDARNPQNLAVTKIADISMAVNGETGGIAISGGKLYVATATGLSIYNISQ
jgi:uncharacterized protein (TIGR03437 family)